MMMSPESYIASFQNESYEKCIKERDNLIRSIRRFEKGKTVKECYLYHPLPDVIYQCELEYLSKICDLIANKYQSSEQSD